MKDVEQFVTVKTVLNYVDLLAMLQSFHVCHSDKN